MKPVSAWRLLILACILAGCAPNKEAAGPAQTMPLTGTSLSRATTAPAAGLKPYRLVIQVRTAAIEVPAGAASASDELWSYLDEEGVAAARSAALGRNGLRVGVARAANLPDLTRVLKQMTGREVGYNTVTTLPGKPAPLLLKRQQPEATIFTFHGDRELSGADYPPGDYQLAVSCTIDEDNPSRLILTALPQIRSSEMETRLIEDPRRPGFQTFQETFSFEPVQFQLAVAAKDVVVLGPGGNCERPNSIGRQFMVTSKDGVPFETVLIMIPEVISAEAR